MPFRNIVRPNHVRRIVAGQPQLVYNGGPLLANVEATTIYWGSAWQTDPLRAQLDGFFDFVVSSSLVDQLTEYNVPGFSIGHGRHVASVQIVSDPPAIVDDTQIQTFVQQLITAGTVPAQDANSLYFVFTPGGVTVTLQGSASCQQFCGYHNSPDGNLFYAVVPYANCNGCQFAGNLLDSMTVIASHEFCEAITDPVPGAGWYDNANGEIGDICEGSNKVINMAQIAAGTVYTVSGSASADATGVITASLTFTPPPPPGQSYMVQKEWSNAQGACV